VPSNFWVGNWGDCEVELTWTNSTDDVDPQFAIRYDVFINGRFDHSTGQLFNRAVAYADQHGLNTFSIIAVDSAGNRSAAAEASDNLQGCFP
jgi:hypothetical protein